MKNIVDFKIVDGASKVITEKKIMDLINNGYKLHGNLLPTIAGHSIYFYQVMVKYESNDLEKTQLND